MDSYGAAALLILLGVQKSLYYILESPGLDMSFGSQGTLFYPVKIRLGVPSLPSDALLAEAMFILKIQVTLRATCLLEVAQTDKAVHRVHTIAHAGERTWCPTCRYPSDSQEAG